MVSLFHLASELQMQNCGDLEYACMCAQLLGCVQLFATPWAIGHQAPLSVGFFQARILKWVAISFSRNLPPPRDHT